MLDREKAENQDAQKVPLLFKRHASSQICLFPEPSDVPFNCNIDYWLHYWTHYGALPWHQRKLHMQALGDDVDEQFKRILLSQGPDTPYQDRLRAQNMGQDLLERLTSEAARFLEVAILQTSQQLLEFESTVTILSQLNAAHTRRAEELQIQVQQQQNKLEKLMRIEANMIPEQQGNNQ